MKLVSKSRILGLVIFIIPLLTINSILLFSQSFQFKYEPVPGNYYKDIKIYDAGKALRDKQDVQRLGFAIPYIDGATSISRLGRVFPNWLVFKPLMIFTGILLYFFWGNQKKIFADLDADQKMVNKFYYFGLVSGITLIIHSIFLGIKFDYDLYKLFRRVIMLVFIIFEVVAQAYLVITLYLSLIHI